MKKKNPNIVFLIAGLIFMLIALAPLAYFGSYYLGRKYIPEYYLEYLVFRNGTYYQLAVFTSIFFFLSIIFLKLFLMIANKEPFSYVRSLFTVFSILIFVVFLEVLLMYLLFPPEPPSIAYYTV